jgi:hypothetical protein
LQTSDGKKTDEEFDNIFIRQRKGQEESNPQTGAMYTRQGYPDGMSQAALVGAIEPAAQIHEYLKGTFIDHQ